MTESMETESAGSVSDDEENTESQESPSKNKGNRMDVEEEEDGDDEETEEYTNNTTGDEPISNKENKNKNKSNKTPRARKRKKSADADETSPPTKKRKIDDSPQTLKIKIGSDSFQFLVTKLQKIPFFKNKIIADDDNDALFKFKSPRNGTFTSDNYKLTDFKHMLTFMDDDALDHIDTVKELETLIHCCEKFKIKLDSNEVRDCYDECGDDDEIYKKWKNAPPKMLKDLYKTIKTDNEEKQNEDDEPKKAAKKRPTADGPDQAEKKSKRKSKRVSNRILEQLKNIPQYLQLSDDENDNSHNKNVEKSKRIQHQGRDLMTQPDEDGDAMMSSSDNTDNDINEKYIKKLHQINLQQISQLNTQTIHRLCTSHKINIHKALSKADEKRKKDLEAKNKRFQKKFIEDKRLIKRLKALKKTMEKEVKIKSLKHVHLDDIGDLQRETLIRLCKVHRIKANQKLQTIIEALEDRKEHPVDEDDFIRTLKDVDIDDINDLDRAVLLRLCKAHNIGTTKKKKKKRRKRKKKGADSDDSDSERDDSDYDHIDLNDDELRTLLEKTKQAMNEKRQQRQKNKIDKLTQAQQDIVNVGFRENYLTISGSNVFKEDALGLVALCNNVTIKKGNNYSAVEDELHPYKVCISESGARTIKVMMTIARGGSVVNAKWLNHSIKGKKWIDPQQYEEKWATWKRAAAKSRESRIRKRRKRVSDIGSGSESEDEDDLDAITGPLLGEFSIYIQDRPGVKPSALVLKHLAWSAGAQIVDKRWKSERLKKKAVKDGLDEDIEEKMEETLTANKAGSGKKKRRAKRRKNESESEEDERDEDSDMDGKRKRDKKKKRQRITPLRSRSNRNRNRNSEEESDGDEDGDGDVEVVKKKRQTKLRKFRLIISHPARYKYLKLKKNNRIPVVGQSWLFQSIEHYKVAEFDEYIVEPNKQPSRSPVH